MTEQIQGTIVATDSESLSTGFQKSVIDKTNYPIIKLPFPPVIEPKDLILKKRSPQDNPDGKPTRAPNAFIIYRKAYVKSARDQGYILPMTLISSMASASWDQESEEIKNVYKKIAKETHKLVKEMYPKKSNQRKRKEKWNLVSFQKDNKPKNKFEKMQISTQDSIHTPNLLLPSPSTPISTASSSSSSSMSSPDLSEFDTTSVTETSPILQQQTIFSPTIINYDNEGQISNDYFVDEINNADLPNSFQEYLDQPINNYNYFPETYSYYEFPGTSIDDLERVIHNNFQSSLNMTLADAFGIINSENFDLGFEL